MSYSFPLGFSGLAGDHSAAQTSAGTTQSDAAALIADYVLVSAVTAGAGVRLPALQPREVKIVVNGDSTDALLVYPVSGAAINGATANEALSLAAGAGAMFIGMTATVVAAIY